MKSFCAPASGYTFSQRHGPGSLHGAEEAVAGRVAALGHPVYLRRALGNRGTRQFRLLNAIDACPIQVGGDDTLAGPLVHETAISVFVTRGMPVV